MKTIKKFMMAVVEVIQETRRLQAEQYKRSPLENYINSKKPTSASDVEHWTRKYYDGQARGL
jgi:glycine cleavage system protein P-like pyridoxal-binding family